MHLGFQSIGFQLLGGHIKDFTDGSFYPRQSNFFLDTATFWNNQQSSQARQKWAHDLDDYILSKNDVTMYIGFPLPYTDLINKYGNKIYYGENYKKLLKIKNVVDPLNLLGPTGTL